MVSSSIALSLLSIEAAAHVVDWRVSQPLASSEGFLVLLSHGGSPGCPEAGLLGEPASETRVFQAFLNKFIRQFNTSLPEGSDPGLLSHLGICHVLAKDAP